MENQREHIKTTLSSLILSIAPEADLSKLDPDSDMRDELDLDSMDFINLLEGIAKQLRVNIPESDYQKVKSLQSLIDYISSHSS